MDEDWDLANLVVVQGCGCDLLYGAYQPLELTLCVQKTPIAPAHGSGKQKAPEQMVPEAGVARVPEVGVE